MNKKVKRIAAWIAIGLLLCLYLSSLLAALFLPQFKDGLFMTSMFCTIIIPIWLYGFIWFYKRTHPEGTLDQNDIKKMNKEYEKEDESSKTDK